LASVLAFPQQENPTLLPESEPFHLLLVISHRSISIDPAVKIKIHQLLQVRTDDLVFMIGIQSRWKWRVTVTSLTCIDEDDLVEAHREKHIQKEDLVAVE
jgi:hypothetical protein